MRSDNGPQFVSRAIVEWMARTGLATASTAGASTATRTVFAAALAAAGPPNSNCAINHADRRFSRKDSLETAEQDGRGGSLPLGWWERSRLTAMSTYSNMHLPAYPMLTRG